jgi:Putative prokaryotic signal transducing protein
VKTVLFLALAFAGLALMLRLPRRRAEAESGPAIGAAEMIAVSVVPNVAEAELVCGMLRANGVACRADQTDFGAGAMDGIRGGPQRIFVQENDVTRALDLLAEAR